MATEAPPAPPVDAPPLPSHVEVSKSIFNTEKAKVDGTVPPPVIDDVPQVAPDPDAPPVPPKKGAIPDDVIDPGKATKPTVHEDVAEILAAELPKGAKKEQIDSFGKLKERAAAKLQAQLDRAAELEKQLAGATTQKEIEDLRTALAAAQEKASGIEEKWSKEAFASSPKFQAQFVEREQTALDLAKSYLDGTEIKQDIIDLAAHATPRKRIELLKDAGIDDTVIQLIAPHLAAYDTVQREKQGALADWKNKSKEWQEEATQRSQAERQKKTEREEKIWQEVTGKVDLLPLRKSKDSPEWNARAEQIIANAKKVFNGEGVDLATFAEKTLKAEAYDAQQEVVEHLRGEVTSLRAENAKLKSASPGGSNSAGTNDGKPADTSKMSAEERARNTFNSEKAKLATA